MSLSFFQNVINICNDLITAFTEFGIINNNENNSLVDGSYQPTTNSDNISSSRTKIESIAGIEIAADDSTNRSLQNFKFINRNSS